MRRLLTLDQASRVTGWAYFEDKELKAYGKFTAESDDFGERLLFIRNKVKSLIDKYDINEVIFEDIQYQKEAENHNVQTFKKLAEVFGVIYELVTELGIKHDAYLAEVWRNGIGISGGHRPDKKRRTQQYVQQLYNIKATQDECDAIGIGSYATGQKKIKIPKIKDHDWSD